MPKLEIGDHPTAWTADQELLRRVGIDITGSGIHLEGMTTINDGFAIGLDGSMTANNGTFAGFVRTKPRVITAITDDLLMSQDFISPNVEDTNMTSEYPDCLLPWLTTSTGSGDNHCISLDLMKSGANPVFYGNGMMSVLVHLPFMAPHPNSVYASFDMAYYKGANGHTGPGIYPSTYPTHGSNEAWNACCPEVLRIRSFVGAQVEIANMTDGNIAVCGLFAAGVKTVGTIVIPSESINDAGSSFTPKGVNVNATQMTSPWQKALRPTRGIVRATCIRVTESGSNLTDLERIFWRVDSYAQIDKKYTAAALAQ
jgi:hypothetical protein